MQSKVFKAATASLVAAVLAACGGGGGTDMPVDTPTARTLTLTGTAATGFAIPGAIVNAKCQVGAGAATTSNDGSYNLAITEGRLPCVLQLADPVDGMKLHGVAGGDGDSAVANITQLTHLVSARVLQAEPEIYFGTFDPKGMAEIVSLNNIQAAQVEVQTVLLSVADMDAQINFTSGPFKAATPDSPNAGDRHDRVLDALKLQISLPQIGTLGTAMAGGQSVESLKQLLADMVAAAVVPPTAHAGAAQSVVAGATVVLDASASSAAAGKPLTYAWTLAAKPANSTAVLARASSAKPTFVADVAGTYVASVIVNDGLTASSAAAVTITASAANAAPVAHAGSSQNVVAGNAVTLDGSASSDANNDPLTYAWKLTSRPAASLAALTGDNSAKPTFTADVPGSYIASLVVNDGQVNSAPVTVSITAAVANAAPVAHAGAAQNVLAGAAVKLDGSASSDANGDMLTYEWTLTSKPAGSVAVLANDKSALATFTADVAGTYIASLRVHDGKLSSSPVSVSITATAANAAPVAHAGTDQNVIAGPSPIDLDGSRSSDANGDPLMYQWTFVSVPANSAPQPFHNGRNSARPSFHASVPGTYVVSLVVSDGALSSTPATVTITATAMNSAPNANAGVAQNVQTGTMVTLDGSSSNDADGDPLGYEWRLTAKPAGSAATLSSPTAAKPSFTADLAGSYVATLVVNDGKASSTAATVSVTASAHILTLSRTSCFVNCVDEIVPLPYAANVQASGGISCVGSCSPNHTVETFKLQASGRNFTISNLQARNLSGTSIVPVFNGLANGQTIAAGQAVRFTLESQFTRGSEVQLQYSFTVLETGETFSYNVRLRTN